MSAETAMDSSSEILKMAIVAVGGQGGGVLSNWVADLATLGGYSVQVTSVAGVAQRTGATIYYVEMAPKSTRPVVFGLSPAPGDIDVLIASELMEAGRAVLRGFVTPDRTTLIASSHRILAVSEKQEPGDGRKESEAVLTSLRSAARQLVCFDMETLARDAGSVISASLFGGLARAEVLPFPVEMFETVIKGSGRGVEASLAAFHAALNYDRVSAKAAERAPQAGAKPVAGKPALMRQWQDMQQRVQALPLPVHAMANAGLRRVVDYQDLAYGRAYLEHLDDFLALDDPAQDYQLSQQAAKYIANAMCYDDILRVADLKTRSARQHRLRREQEIGTGQIVQVTEYFHPRPEELTSLLPPGLANRVGQNRWMQGLLARLTRRGRRLRSDRLRGFLLLWLLAALRPWRPRLMRHQVELAHLHRLKSAALALAGARYDLACELLACQRLIKGYSDTHKRGLSKFYIVFSAIPLIEARDDGADWLRRLRQAALMDAEGEALTGAMRTLRSFTDDI
ncbi:putative indolepyruvate oxidoreductase subunit B [Phaeobacter sp. CECT 5382]|uniref:indolepyruvate oxidoreductase subunit beta family protein n=1 Tax=Phaeobacter sp. CECT 5382 TaxID=1712645 RepID=UPI0006DA027C|nr:indolepyruvate oxidoreductase subunit beta family protein [Phaeobacter sp. CECT 5382]CUH89482.1 putative indolepyruvate oxidoreductase subunit B [Phaeobacter sp. CECT 5382]